MMNRLLEIHDSMIESIEHEKGEDVITFSHAYMHESSGNPGIDPGTGWSQRAVIRVEPISSDLPKIVWPFLIVDGTLIVDDVVLENEIPIPFPLNRSVVLRLSGFENHGSGRHHTIVICGERAKFELQGAPRYIEAFKGIDQE